MKTLEAYYPLIGKIVVKFQDLDFFLNVLMTGLLKEDPNVTMAYAVSLSFSKKIDVLKSIAPFKFKHQDLHDTLDKSIGLMSKAEELRNRIIHASYLGSSEEGAVYVYKPRASRKHGMRNGGIRNITTKELEESLEAIQNAFNSATSLGRELEKRKIISIQLF